MMRMSAKYSDEGANARKKRGSDQAKHPIRYLHCTNHTRSWHRDKNGRSSFRFQLCEHAMADSVKTAQPQAADISAEQSEVPLTPPARGARASAIGCRPYGFPSTSCAPPFCARRLSARRIHRRPLRASCFSCRTHHNRRTWAYTPRNQRGIPCSTYSPP